MRWLISLRPEEEEIKITLFVGPHAEKFTIVSKDHGRTHKCNFSVSERKYLFWANLVQNIKIVSLT